MSTGNIKWGIDLGGTKIEGVILDTSNGLQVVTRLRVPTEQQNGYQHILKQIARLVDTMSAESKIIPSSIGIGHPGVVDPFTHKIKNSNTQCLNGQPLQLDLEKVLGVPVKCANDANCFAVAEANLGVVKDMLPNARVVFGIIMGTGVGGGLVVDGKAVYGRHGIGGEWGHNVLEEGGDPCYCGKSGCVEQVISGPALERYYQRLSGQSLHMPEIVTRYQDHSDPHADATMQRLIAYFGKGVAQLINILDPDAIVLGGGVGNIDVLYTQGLWEIEKHIFNYEVRTPILKPTLGDSAGVFGAALL